MNRILFALIFLVIGNVACSKKKRSAPACNWTYKGVTYTSNKTDTYSDSDSKIIFYMADTTTSESLNFHVPFLSIQTFDLANPADSAGLQLNHTKNDTTYIGLTANSGTIHITSLSMNLASANFTAILYGDTCTGSCTDIPYY